MSKMKLSWIWLVVGLGLVYWNWLLPGPRVANDLPLVSLEFLKTQMDFPMTWSAKGAEGLGEYAVFTIWSWPFIFISGLLANLGIDFALQERLIIILPLLIFGSLGIWKIGDFLKLSDKAKLISALFYLTNTYLLLLIDGGQLSVALTLAWLPITYLAIEKATRQGLYQKLLASLAVWVLGFLDIRFILVVVLLFIIRFLFGLIFDKKINRFEFLKSFITTGILIGIVLFGLNIYWIIPLVKEPLQQGIYQQLTQPSSLSYTTLGHSLFLISPHWYENRFGQISNIRFEFVIIPVLVFLSFLLKKKNYWVGFWALMAILSVFLTKGFGEPLGFVYSWLFSNLPGFSLFRDSTKFFSLIVLSYSILLGITVDQLLARFKKMPKNALIAIIFITLLVLVLPTWSNQMTGTFSYSKDSEFIQINNLLKSDQNFSRVLWVPSVASMGYSSPLHPSIEGSRLAKKRPLLSGTVGGYETLNYLREAQYMGELSNVLGIGYVVYPKLDLANKEIDETDIKYYETFLGQLKLLPWLEETNIPEVLKTKSHQDQLFIATNTWFVIGSDDVLANLKLSENSFIFTDQSVGLLENLVNFPQAKIVLNNKSQLDLTAGFIKRDNLIFPATFLSKDPNETGWWKRDSGDFLSWRDFLQNKYQIDNSDFDLGGGVAVAEGEHSFTINLNNESEAILLVRSLNSLQNGRISFYQNSRKIGTVDKFEIPADTVMNKSFIKLTGYKEIPDKVSEFESSQFGWSEVGPVNGQLPLEIRTEEGLNVINALAIVSKTNLDKFKEQTEELNIQNRIVYKDYLKSDSTNSGKLSFKEIAPTHFKVSVKNVTSPTTIIFAQAFDPRWQLNGQNSTPIYGLVNGFSIDKDGDYDLVFIPQKYILNGLLISLITLVSVIGSLFYLKSKKHKIKQ